MLVRQNGELGSETTIVMFNAIYHNRRVLITGHTGFKGSWLALWLSQMGARVTGYSLQPPTEPNHFDLLDMGITSIIGDIRDVDKVKRTFKGCQPEIVFHLAAQPIVRLSYKDPIGTFTSNVMGTINILEAARESRTVRAFVNVTSDKCYENKGWERGYRENDPLGGYDPYSASKGCSELITACWRNSYLNPKDHGATHFTLLASGRAGNVIGGGDWAIDRLIPDIMRSASQNRTVTIRSPRATRPWQHVLEPLGSYLLLASRMLGAPPNEVPALADAWNFGPEPTNCWTVARLVDEVVRCWGTGTWRDMSDPAAPHEASYLALCCDKATRILGWHPVWDVHRAVVETVAWFQAFAAGANIADVCKQQINDYCADACCTPETWMKS